MDEEDNRILDELTNNKEDITTLACNLRAEVTILSDQLTRRVATNESLRQKASSLSKTVIELHRKHIALLERRHNLKFNTSLQSEIPTTVELESVTKTNCGAKDTQPAAQNALAELVSKKLCLTEAEKLEIERGLADFLLSSKQKLKDLRKKLPILNQVFHIHRTIPYSEFGADRITCLVGKYGFIAFATGDNVLMLNTADYIKSKNLKLHQDVCCMDIINDKEVLIGTADGKVMLGDMRRNSSHIVYVHHQSVTCVKTHPNSIYCASTSGNFWALLDTHNRKLLRMQDTGNHVSAMDIHPDGSRIATASKGTIQFWDFRGNGSMHSISLYKIRRLQFLLQGNWLCAGIEGGVMLVNIVKHPSESTNWIIPQTEKENAIWDLDKSGNHICCCIGTTIRLLTTSRKTSGAYEYKLKEVSSNEIGKNIISLTFVDGASSFAAATANELHIYKW